MIPIAVTSFVALLSTGLLAGILLGHRLGTSFALPRIPDTSFVQFQQIVHRIYVRLMPAIQMASIVGHWAWVYLIRGSVSGPAFALILTASVGTTVVFAITLSVNVPVNKKLMTWNPAAPPANAREVWRPWDKGNTARTILATLVFVIDVLAVSLSAMR